MTRSAPRLLAVLLLALTACPNRVVVVNGQSMPASEADDLARRDLATLRGQLAALPAPEAAARLEAFAARYQGVPAAAEALHEAADRWAAVRRPEKAAQDLARLLTDYPLYPRANEAKYALALAEIDQGRARDGLLTIDSLYPHLSEAARRDAATRAAEAAAAAGALPEEVRWRSEVAAQASGEARAEALRRAAEAVDRLTFLDVAKLREALPGDAPVQEALAMKLARIHLHLRDYPRALEAAREVVLRWPDGAYAAEAKAIGDRIARLTFVRPNVIGLAVPLTGNYRRWGEAIVDAVGLALEGSGLRTAVRDTRGEPDGAAAAIQALVLEEGAIGVLGGVVNAEAERAAATAEELHVPLLSLSKLEGLTDAGPHVFQNMLTASAQAKALADFAMGRRGMTRFAIMYPQIAYGVDLANAFWDEVEARGGEIRAAESYAPDRTTFTPLVKDMVGKLYLDERTDFQEELKEIGQKEKDPFRRHKAVEKARERLDPITDFDAVFIPDFSRNVKLIAPALAVEDVVTQTCLPDEVERIKKTTGRTELKPVQLLGTNGWGGDPSLFETGAGRHVRCAVFVDGFFAGSSRAGTKAFVEAYAKKFPDRKDPPGILEASAFDAAGMAREVLVRRKAATREALRDGLAAVKGFKGATGDITMGPRRTPDKELFFLTVDQSGLRELTPEELAAPGAGGGGR